MRVVIARREAGVLNPLEDHAESHAKTIPLEMQRRQTLRELGSGRCQVPLQDARLTGFVVQWCRRRGPVPHLDRLVECVSLHRGASAPPEALVLPAPVLPEPENT